MLVVSIHAPAWGATPKTPFPMTGRSGFNPRTRVGCDLLTHYQYVMDKQFQSTHPRGVRQAKIDQGTNLELVSIHAPAWGATSKRVCPKRHTLVSIHAPAWGATTDGSTVTEKRCLFQSTHPRGVRRKSLPKSCTLVMCLFQSTHPRGVRLLVAVVVPVTTFVSIHAPAWGATCAVPSFTYHSGGFQSTHPRGVRHELRQACEMAGLVSIHAPAWGATL